MEGSAILSLLKAHSQNNSYPQAVYSTYLMATGAQRQHFSVLASMGISMGYTSVINQHSGTKKRPAIEAIDNDSIASTSNISNIPHVDPILPEEASITPDGGDTVVATDNKEPAKSKPKKRTLGTLFQLSAACRTSARQVGSTGLFVTVYDNINMMVRVAEQVLGRKSELAPHLRYPKTHVHLL